MHAESHEHAGRTVAVTLASPIAIGRDHGITTIARFYVDDWWDKLTGESWQDSNGNPAAMAYAMRSGLSMPWDDDVVYGKNLDSGMGHLVHVSEIDTATTGRTNQ